MTIGCHKRRIGYQCLLVELYKMEIDTLKRQTSELENNIEESRMSVKVDDDKE